MNKTIEINKCRSCGSTNLVDVLSLGDQFISNFIKSEDEKGTKIPLDLVLCTDCTLSQLRHNAPSELMWNDQYGYKSGISSTIRNDLKDIVDNVQKLSNVGAGDLVIDIGCNDGTLLGFYPENLKKVGFEPSSNVAAEAKSKGFDVINNFFNSINFKEKFPNKKAKIITAISMFYDLEDPNQFVKDIVECLDDDGVFVIQQNYLVTMLENNAFDNILHEHREYYSLTSLNNLLKKYDLEVFDIIVNDINGGSIRTYIKKKGNNIKSFDGAETRINEILNREDKMLLHTRKPYDDFAARLSSIKERLINFIKSEKAKGKRIAAYGASTRGNVALQYFDLNSNLIDFISDKNSEKWGKKTIGTLIPIVSPAEIMQRKPDYLIIMTWHFLNEIMKQEEAYRSSGGKFITAMPDFKVL